MNILLDCDIGKPKSSGKEDDLRKERGIDACVYQLCEGECL